MHTLPLPPLLALIRLAFPPPLLWASLQVPLLSEVHHFEEVTGLALVGSTIASVGIDATIRQWSLRPDELAQNIIGYHNI
jgi:hypothetical protein